MFSLTFRSPVAFKLKPEVPSTWKGKVDKTSYDVHELKINKKKIGETCVNCSGRNVSRIDAALLLMLSAAITWYRICFQFVRFIPFCPYSSSHNLYVDGSSKFLVFIPQNYWIHWRWAGSGNLTSPKVYVFLVSLLPRFISCSGQPVSLFWKYFHSFHKYFSTISS